MSAAQALATALKAVIGDVEGISGVFDGEPVRAGDAHVAIDMGPQTDWSHKGGEGCELRLALLVRCGGERPDQARLLADAVRGAVGGIGPALDGWRLVTLAFLRARTLREPGPRWTAVIEYRARLLATP